jgi:hypothetical protein
MKNSIIFTLLLTTSAAYAEKKPSIFPDFNDYPAEPVFSGVNHPIAHSHEREPDYKLLYTLKQISNSTPNFNGHYVIFTYDCGGSVLCGGAYDVKTGKIAAGFPNAYYGQNPNNSEDGFSADYKLNSSLIVFFGEPADGTSGQDNIKQMAVRFYKFENYDFKFISAEKIK